MKAFLEEYGLIIVVVAVIMVMLLLGTTVGGDAKANIVATVKNFLTTAEQVYPDLENPGGAGSGAVTGELNEYGFYYGKKYETSFSDENTNQKLTFIFNEDGSADLINYYDYKDGSFTYENQLIKCKNLGTNVVSTFANVSEDGTEMSVEFYQEPVVLKLSKPSQTNMNEYGFYYKEEYVGPADGFELKWIFYEDSTAEEYQFGAMPAGTFTYENGKLLMGGTEYGTFNADGKKLTMDGIVLTLVDE